MVHKILKLKLQNKLRGELLLKLGFVLAILFSFFVLIFYQNLGQAKQSFNTNTASVTCDYLNPVTSLYYPDPAPIYSEGEILTPTSTDVLPSELLANNNQKQKFIPKDSDSAANLKGFSQNIPILMYHYVEVPSATTTLKGLYLDPVIFDKQLQELKTNNYTTLFASELANSILSETKLSGNNIVLTFDDGYEDFYTKVWPVLKKYNYKATVYVIINKLDISGYLTREQVKELAASNLVEIGSHTFNHPDLRSLKNKDAKFEIQASKKILEQISGRPVLTFAYPFGYYKKEFFALASEVGYKAAVSVQPGVKQGINNIWEWRRLRPGERTGGVFIKWLEAWQKANY